MAKLKIRTTDSAVYTRAKELDIPYSRRSDYEVEFEQVVDDKLAISLGYEISTRDDQVLLPYAGLNDNEKARIFADAGFQAPAFLQNYMAKIKVYNEESQLKQLQRQRAEEAEQRREFAKKQAHELLADEFKKVQGEIDELKAEIQRKNKRIDELESILRQLICKSTDEQLEALGLYKPVPEEESEQPTEAQQEALDTLGLDDC